MTIHSNETALTFPDQNTRLPILQVSACKKALIVLILITFFGTLLIPFLSTEYINITTSTSKINKTTTRYSNISKTTTTTTTTSTFSETTVPIKTVSILTSTTYTQSLHTSTEVTTNLLTSTKTSTHESEQISQSNPVLSNDLPEEYSTKEDFSTVESTIVTTFTTSTTTVEPKNLLINPGAEEQFTGWTHGSSRHVIVDSGGRFNKNYRCRSGTYCFAGGPVEYHEDQTKIIQRINLLNGIQNFTEEQIDSGRLTVYISFYYQTLRTMTINGDIVKVDVSFHGTSGSLDPQLNTGNLRCKSSNPDWCHYETSLQLIPGTRFINYVVLFYKESRLSRAIDAYNDDNSLIIK